MKKTFNKISKTIDVGKVLVISLILILSIITIFVSPVSAEPRPIYGWAEKEGGGSAIDATVTVTSTEGTLTTTVNSFGYWQVDCGDPGADWNNGTSFTVTIATGKWEGSSSGTFDSSSGYTNMSTITLEYSPGGGGGGGGGGTANVEPTADTGGPYSGYVNSSISFDGSGSSDPDGTISNYTWDFGDGLTWYGVGPTHVYVVAKTYNVTLTVTDDYGATANIVTTATISEIPSDEQGPTADAGGPYEVLTNQTVTFDGSASSDPDGTISNYTWDFGDGLTGYGVGPTHVYVVAKTYNLRLTVTDDDGLTNDDVTTIVISLDSDGDGWSDDMENSYGTNTINATDYPMDADGDGIPDNDSLDGNYTGDSDDDNDGLDDAVEEELGSDLANSNDVKSVDIEGGYVVDTNDDGRYDKYYNASSSINTTMELQDDGSYLIDSNGDGNWDYIYNPASGEISAYEIEKPEEFTWIQIIVIIFIIIIVIIAILFKTGYLYFEKTKKK